jgi:hypothetical protein
MKFCFKTLKKMQFWVSYRPKKHHQLCGVAALRQLGAQNF